MDALDRQILALLEQNARMPVKEIAQLVRLTSPAVSSRIRRMEQQGIIAGYTVVCRQPERAIGALISVSIAPCDRESFLEMTRQCPQVCQCFHVTGGHSFIAKVSCHNMQDLEQLITRFQQMGPTSTQIILSTPVERSPLFEELPQECNESPC